MEPLKVGDMVVLVRGNDEEMIGWTGVVQQLDWFGVGSFKGTEGFVGQKLVAWLAKNGTECASRRSNLLKITPPPTMIETEQEITA